MTVDPENSTDVAPEQTPTYGKGSRPSRKYTLAVVSACLQVVLVLAIYGSTTFTNVFALLNFLFDAALVALLLHPMSRDYQRIWFR